MAIWQLSIIFAADKVSANRVGSSESSPTHIVLWCNGNTTDFGSVVPSSTLGRTTAILVFVNFACERPVRRGTAVDCEVSSSILFVYISKCISIS